MWVEILHFQQINKNARTKEKIKTFSNIFKTVLLLNDNWPGVLTFWVEVLILDIWMLALYNKSFNEIILPTESCLVHIDFSVSYKFMQLSFFFPQFSGLYIVSFVVITLGFIMFNILPTYTADQSYATNDRAYHLASSADVQQDGDIVVDWLQKEGQENEDRIGSSHRAHCNGFCSQIWSSTM